MRWQKWRCWLRGHEWRWVNSWSPDLRRWPYYADLFRCRCGAEERRQVSVMLTDRTVHRR